MGWDVMARHRSGKYTMSTSSTVASSLSSDDGTDAMTDASSSKSLTPQRKHHKLLRDGSEVWSDPVEKIFVEGLKKYWESPWATYSRGRSRWRNQFLVDHLKSAGIERSKKQVASHIQVLRNMWRGEPEFHLVAGGEELFLENGLLASPNTRETGDQGEGFDAFSSSTSSTPDASSLSLSPSGPVPQLASPMYMPSTSDADIFGSHFTLDPQPSFHVPPSPHRVKPAVKLEPLVLHPTPSTLPQGHSPFTDFFNSYYTPSMPTPVNRVSNVVLWMEGMLPFNIDVDTLASASTDPSPVHGEPPRVLLRMKLNIPAGAPIINDPHSSMLHGLQGIISFGHRWTSAKCLTRVYTGRMCVSRELADFDQLPPSPSHADLNMPPQIVVASLPESSLSKCQWLDHNQDTIIQQIVADREVLAVLIYHISRITPDRMSSAELLSFQRYTVQKRETISPSQHPSSPPPHSPMSPMTLSNGYQYPSPPAMTSLFSRASTDSEEPPNIYSYPLNGNSSFYSAQPPADAPPRMF